MQNSVQNDFAITLGNMHKRNMTQLPQGGQLPQNQEVIDSLDTSTKIELLRKSNQLETLTVKNVRASLEQIKEKIHQSTSENPLVGDQQTENELVSIQSQ